MSIDTTEHTAKFWYSKKQEKIIKAMDCALKTRKFVTIEGVEIEYTEMYTGPNQDFKSNWDDAVFLGEGSFPTRFEIE